MPCFLFRKVFPVPFFWGLNSGTIMNILSYAWMVATSIHTECTGLAVSLCYLPTGSFEPEILSSD